MGGEYYYCVESVQRRVVRVGRDDNYLAAAEYIHFLCRGYIHFLCRGGWGLLTESEGRYNEMMGLG
jgi:hypothetical protein